ncbi:hypothetical protein GQ53DRAFT_729280 [Thozetella sp. PMI_491]|nr:hypothetical protein GQ53DRAFT_729280 [Thozetella sp. PMI_491]
MQSLVQPNAWVALQLPSESTRVLKVTPNTTISLGKYGSFPSNLIIERPYHITYEVLDKKPGESSSRLRVVPASELYADVFAEEETQAGASPGDGDNIISAEDGVEYSLVDEDSGNVVVRSSTEIIDENARQTLTMSEIEELKRDGAGAGKDLIAKLMLSHTALDQKTAFSVAKYKLLKTKKYIRRFQVLPLDAAQFAKYQMDDRDSHKIMDMRAEMMGLVGCWANVHYGGEDRYLEDPNARPDQGEEVLLPPDVEKMRGRWLIVDDVSGMLVAAMAERMGILNPKDGEVESSSDVPEQAAAERDQPMEDASHGDRESEHTKTNTSSPLKHPSTSDFYIPYSQNNTLTLVHAAGQPNLSFLTYYGFDATNPNPPPHPLVNHLLTLSWLQLVKPEVDNTYSTPPPTATPEELASWKSGRRGHFHRKRRRYTRTRFAVDSARAGGFAGLVCASTTDPVSILRYTLPLLAGGASVAIYSAALEPLTRLADCFSVARRGAWAGGQAGPEVHNRTPEELERWEGTPEFPLNPTLLLGTGIQTSRVRSWQVLPGRTHPLMTARGGPEGYVFTGWRAKPAEGRVEARGKFKKRKIDALPGGDSEATETPETS